MDVQKKEQTVAAAVKQTAAVDAEITAEAATSPDSETTPAVVFSGLSFFPVCAATAVGEITGTAAVETAAAVIPAGFLLFSFFCAETMAAAADFHF